MEYLFQKCSWQQFLKTQVSVSTAASLKPKKAQWDFQLPKLEKNKYALENASRTQCAFYDENYKFCIFLCAILAQKKKLT